MLHFNVFIFRFFLLSNLQMLKKIKIRTLIITISVTIIISYFFASSVIDNQNFSSLKSLLSSERKELIKKYFFPYKAISQRDREIYTRDFERFELDFKKNNYEIRTVESYVNLSNNKNLKKYNLTGGFYAGIHNAFPGSGYIDFHADNLIVVSARGVLALKKNINDTKENFIQIKNNINDFIGVKQFAKTKQSSIKDIHISNNKVYISYIAEVVEDCYNLSVIYGDIDYKNIIFKKLFAPEECVHSKDNLDKEFSSGQSGGRIVSFGNNHILLSIGEFRNRFLAQDIKGIFGKVIKVNIDNGNYKIISMGHRNPRFIF